MEVFSQKSKGMTFFPSQKERTINFDEEIQVSLLVHESFKLITKCSIFRSINDNAGSTKGL